MFNPLDFNFTEKPYHESDKFNFKCFSRFVKKINFSDIELEYTLIQIKENKRWNLSIEIPEKAEDNFRIKQFLNSFENWVYSDHEEKRLDITCYIFNFLKIETKEFAISLFSSFDKNLLF